jgi:hypothetical protein
LIVKLLCVAEASKLIQPCLFQRRAPNAINPGRQQSRRRPAPNSINLRPWRRAANPSVPALIVASRVAFEFTTSLWHGIGALKNFICIQPENFSMANIRALAF